MSGTELVCDASVKRGKGRGKGEGSKRKRTDRGTSKRELEVAEKWRNVDGKRRDKGVEKDRGSNSQ